VKAVLAGLGSALRQSGTKVDHPSLEPVVVAASQQQLELLLGMALELILTHNGHGDVVHVATRRAPNRGKITIANAKWAPSAQDMANVMRENFFDMLGQVVEHTPELLPLALVRATAEANDGRLECHGAAGEEEAEMVLDFPVPIADRTP
jgi:hypothetical protein